MKGGSEQGRAIRWMVHGGDQKGRDSSGKFRKGGGASEMPSGDHAGVWREGIQSTGEALADLGKATAPGLYWVIGLRNKDRSS